ncbi:MAG TPA: pseudouridine synthase, partial [Leptospiraceae bacterium]|nr:pseudouridine synthase [Leptospiraceae bacterium]
ADGPRSYDRARSPERNDRRPSRPDSRRPGAERSERPYSRSDRPDRQRSDRPYPRSDRPQRSDKPYRAEPRRSEAFSTSDEDGAQFSYVPPDPFPKQRKVAAAPSEAMDLFEGSLAGKPSAEKEVRINRYLASAGIGSRRDVEDLVLKGRVEINGRKVSDLFERVSAGDLVRVDGKLIRPLDHKYYIFNKPVGVVCSSRRFGDEEKIIYDYLPEGLRDLKYAGRLDQDSRGLVVLSNDGDFIQAITHPSHRITKKYLVTAEYLPPENVLRRTFVKGIEHDGDILKAISAHIRDRHQGLVEVVLGEGKKRQIRRMFESVGSNVVDLFRTTVGFCDIEKEPLKEGELRAISPEQLLYGE